MTYDKTEMNAFVQNLYDQKMQEGKHGHYETMFHVVHAAIAAYQAKLRQGVELPEPAIYADNGVEGYTQDQLQQYGDARDQAGHLRGLEDAAKVLEENAKQCSLVLERYVLEANAAVIRAMKGGE